MHSGPPRPFGMADSTGNLLRVEGFKVNAQVNGKTVKVTDAAIAGQPEFTALVETAPVVDPDMPLGPDIREASVIWTLRDWLPATMRAATTPAVIAASIDGLAFEMTKREDNVATPFVRFDVVRVL